MGRSGRVKCKTFGSIPIVRLALAFSLSLLPATYSLGARPVTGASTGVRPVRVQIARGLDRVRFRAEAPIHIEDPEGHTSYTHDSEQWLEAARERSDGIRLRGAIWSADLLLLKTEDHSAITVSLHRRGEWLTQRTYPGTLRLTRGDTGRLDLVNLVSVEPYVASVVANEVWPTFAKEALRAQAVAARTFVLYEMEHRNKSRFDVSATQGSQVYRGIRSDQVGVRATKATRHTRGVVMTHEDGGKLRLFCAYYSAACGGLSQSATIFGPKNDIEPLRGGVRCDECRIAPGETYRWGPVRIPLGEVRSRLKASDKRFKSMGAIRRISVIERTSSGRPVRLRVTGSGGTAIDILGERFRLAMGGGLIKSTDCTIRLTDGAAIFDSGRGFGHGLGLCQWGTQGRALNGWSAGRILRYYYPGAKLTRVY